MPGYEPDSQALNNLKSFLEELVHKPYGISVHTKQINATDDSVLTKTQVMAIEQSNRRMYNDDSELTVYILYTNSYFDERKRLGYAYRNTSIVLAGKTIRENSGQWGRLSTMELETRVLEHEMGHLLGLTNLGTPMTTKHGDKKHSGQHCKNKQCLMYAKMETTDYPAYLLKKDRPMLDEDCLEDLQANGGKKNGYYCVSLTEILNPIGSY